MCFVFFLHDPAEVCSSYLLQEGKLTPVGQRYITQEQVQSMREVWCAFAALSMDELSRLVAEQLHLDRSSLRQHAGTQSPCVLSTSRDRIQEVFARHLCDRSFEQRRLLESACGLQEDSAEHGAWRNVLRFFIALSQALCGSLQGEIVRLNNITDPSHVQALHAGLLLAEKQQNVLHAFYTALPKDEQQRWVVRWYNHKYATYTSTSSSGTSAEG